MYKPGKQLLKAVLAVSALAQAEQAAVHDLADSGVASTADSTEGQKLSLTQEGGAAPSTGDAMSAMQGLMAQVQSGNMDPEQLMNNLPAGMVPEEAKKMLESMGGTAGVTDMMNKLTSGEGVDEVLNKMTSGEMGDMINKLGGEGVTDAVKKLQESGVGDIAKKMMSGEGDMSDALKSVTENEGVMDLLKQFGGEEAAGMLKGMAGGGGMEGMMKNMMGGGGDMGDMLKNLPPGTVPEDAMKVLDSLGGMGGVQDLMKDPTKIMDKLGDGTLGKIADQMGVSSMLEAVGGESGVGDLIAKVQEGDMESIMESVGGVEGVAQMLDAAPGMEGVSDMLEPFGGFEGAAEKAQNLMKEVGGIEGAQKIVSNIQETAQEGVNDAFKNVGGLDKLVGVAEEAVDSGVDAVGSVVENVLENEDLQKAIESLGMADMFNDFLDNLGGVDGIKSTMRSTVKNSVSDFVGDLQTSLTGKKSAGTEAKEARAAAEANKDAADSDDEDIEVTPEQHAAAVKALGLDDGDIKKIMDLVAKIPEEYKMEEDEKTLKSDEMVMMELVAQFGTERPKAELLEEVRVLVEEEIPNDAEHGEL